MRIQFNVIVLGGNLTSDPELRMLPSGSAVCDIRMAANEDHKTKEGEKKESTTFIQIVAWGKLAEACSEYLSKGDCILVKGKLKYQQWEKDGDIRSKNFITADSIQFLDTKKRKDESVLDHIEESSDGNESDEPKKTDVEKTDEALENLPF